MSRFVLRLLLLTGTITMGQVILTSQSNPSSNKGKPIIIENADVREIDIGGDTTIQTLSGNVKCYHEGSFFYSEKMIMKGVDMFAYQDVVILQTDSIALYCDSMKYYGDPQIAYLYGKIIMINKSDTLYTEDMVYDVKNKVATYDKKAKILSEGFEIKSLSGRYDNIKKIAVFYTNVSVEGSDIKLYNDTLNYDVNRKSFDWMSPTIIYQDSATLYTEDGYYDYDDDNGLFAGNPIYQSPAEFIKGDTIRIDNEKEIFEVLGSQSQYITATDTAIADYIKSDGSTNQVDLIGNAQYISNDGSRSIGETISYNKSTKAIKMKGGQISDPPYIINATDIDYNKDDKNGILIGAVVWQDTSADTRIDCDTLLLRGDDDYYKATGKELRPLFTQYQEEDTLYISGDTLKGYATYMTEDSITYDTNRITEAIHNVKILSNEYQGKCGNLLSSELDSTFTLTQLPFLWQDTSQMTGDSIVIRRSSDYIEDIFVKQRAMMITSQDFIFYNQIAGQTILLDFEEGSIYQIKVNKEAQSVYYLVDDEDAYIGVNTSKSDFFIMDFEEEKLSTIRHYLDIPSKILPIEGTNHEEIRLEGFDWQWANRPTTLKELLQWTPIAILPSVQNTMDDPEVPQNKITTPKAPNLNKKQ